MGKHQLKNFFSLLLAFSLALAITACGQGAGSDGGDSSNQDGGESSAPDQVEAPVVIPEEPPESMEGVLNLDPATTAMDDEESLLVSLYIYDGLVGIDADGNVVPGLAESWTMSEDLLDIIFVLRPEAQFHDGTPVTADLVMDNFNRWFDEAHALRGEGVYAAWEHYFLGFKGELNSDGTPLSFFDGIEKVDDRTVLVHLNRIMPEILEILANPHFSILDPASLALHGEDYGVSADTVNGSGGYEVGEWNTDGLVLTPFDDYWGEVPTENVEISFE